MSFGKDLSTEFLTLTHNVMLDEVSLFTKLQDAFINLKTRSAYEYAIDIIHGSKSYVDFDFNSTWASNIIKGKNVRRELADMMFVIYSLKQDQIRITYMQNKKGITADKFKADLCQLHLLSQREQITSSALPNCLFGDRDILVNAVLCSVGSYGVFYKEDKNIEMAYYPAYLIQPCNTTGKSVARMAQYDSSNFESTITRHGYVENQGTRHIREFGDALVNMQIGTPINKCSLIYTPLIVFLSGHIPALKQLLGSNNNFFQANQQDLTPSVPVVYAINADMIENNE